MKGTAPLAGDGAVGGQGGAEASVTPELKDWHCSLRRAFDWKFERTQHMEKVGGERIP
jgi:hypothetical protein